MKRLLICNLIFLIGPAFLLAQPIITKMYHLDVGDKYWINIIETEDDITPTEGPDMTWDYTSVSGMLIEGDPFIRAVPSETPFADSAAVLSSNFVMMTWNPDDVDGVKAYNYGVTNNQMVTNTAIAMTNEDNAVYGKYVNPDTSLIFPFTFGNEFESSSEYWGATNKTSPYEYKDVAIKKTKAVGYGTVITPAGTFKNALMLRADITTSLIYNDGTFGGQNLKTTEYVWYVPGIKISVLAVYIFDGEMGGMIKYVAKTEFASGGIDNGGGDDNGVNNDNGSNVDDDDEPYDPIGGWLNVCGSAGEYFEKSAGSLGWTVGEAVIETLEGSSHFFTQGFSQPEDVVTATDKPERDDKILIYPNPFQTELTICMTNFTEPVYGTIYSNTGQALKNFILNDPVSKLQLNDLRPGMYFIRLMKENPKVFIVVKH